MDIMGRGGGYPGVSPPLPPPGLLDCGSCRKRISGGLGYHLKKGTLKKIWKIKLNLRNRLYGKILEKFILSIKSRFTKNHNTRIVVFSH